MTTTQDLNDSIQLYTEQLRQVEQALASANNQDERQELENLQSDLNELLSLTRETLVHESDSTAPDNIDDEFALFMSEINGLEPKPKASEQNVDECDAVKDLVGSKCSAPHTHKWGSKSHHNALICSLDTSDISDVLVKVLFINPTHQEMIPCSYYLEGDCKFSDEKCRYSHGELVSLNELKEYREPQFELLKKKGRKVLVKQKNRLWSKGTVKETDFEIKTCRIQLEETKKTSVFPFEDIFPLANTESVYDEPNSDSEANSSEGEMGDMAAMRHAEIVQRSLLNPAPSQRLGEWEKHTKGIGSKIMQKMGYVVGAGLGSKGEGIVVPVGAQVLPQGKSLDYCMQLREQANGSSDLFSVEKKLMRQKKIQEKKDAKEYARNTQKKDVFSFINSEILGSGEGSSRQSNSKMTAEKSNRLDLPSCSSKNLNVASLMLSERTRRLEVEVERLRSSMTRHQSGSQMHSSLKKQIGDKLTEIAQIQATESSISREQQLRTDKRKMTVF